MTIKLAVAGGEHDPSRMIRHPAGASRGKHVELDLVDDLACWQSESCKSPEVVIRPEVREPEALADRLGIAIRIAPRRNAELAPAITRRHWLGIAPIALAVDQVTARLVCRMIRPDRLN